MRDLPFISSKYISLREDFLSVPVPVCQFSLLIPMQDDDHDACATLDVIDEVCDLQSLKASNLEELEVIDEQLFDYFFGSNFSPNSWDQCELNSESGASTKVKEATPGRPSWRITLEKELITKPTSTSAVTKLPGWLVGTDSKQYGNMEAFDDSGNRFDLMYMCVAESKPASRDKSDKKGYGPVKPKEELEKKDKEHGAKLKPLQTYQTQNKAAPVAKTTREAMNAIGIDENVTLLSDKLRQHFDRLSNVGVPVLGSGNDSNNASKARRKQQLRTVNYITIPAPAKQRRMSSVNELQDERIIHNESRPELLVCEGKDENSNAGIPEFKASRKGKKRGSRLIKKNTKSKRK